MDIFMCWIDVQEYKKIPTPDYRRSMALHIYHKYIKPGAMLEIGTISSESKQLLGTIITDSMDAVDLLSGELFDDLQSKCFGEIFHNVYLPFKNTPQFADLVTTLKKKYNQVRADDFDYYRKLGEGGFGLVVLCRKRSTGKHYAMKIQRKSGLISCYQDDPHRADYEKQAFASSSHPFIVGLDYAFQTETLAIMVLGLATGGDLHCAIRESPTGYLPVERVQFYCAEIALALAHLHQMGLMYRDLKPQNVLLQGDGHVMLVDLGGVLDVGGNVLGQTSESNNLLPFFQRDYQQSFYNVRDHPDEVSGSPFATTTTASSSTAAPEKRRMSIMGTFGYMAPEMVIMLTQNRKEKKGYTNAVDWWSLGCTMYKLLVGERPFSEENLSVFIQNVSLHRQVTFMHNSEYAILFQEIEFPSHVSPEARDVIRKLLNVDPEARLGSGAAGVKEILNHPFFSNIDCNLLSQKHIIPPYRPPFTALPETSDFRDFDHMMTTLRKQDWLEDVIRPEEQYYFDRWGHVSVQAMRIEFGLAHENDQYDSNFKVQHILGERSDDSRASSKKSTRLNSIGNNVQRKQSTSLRFFNM